MIWIACADRKPPFAGTYLLFWQYPDGSTEIEVGLYSRRYLFSAGRGNKYCTHWMPLPEPPGATGNSPAVHVKTDMQES